MLTMLIPLFSLFFSPRRRHVLTMRPSTLRVHLTATVDATFALCPPSPPSPYTHPHQPRAKACARRWLGRSRSSRELGRGLPSLRQWQTHWHHCDLYSYMHCTVEDGNSPSPSPSPSPSLSRSLSLSLLLIQTTNYKYIRDL